MKVLLVSLQRHGGGALDSLGISNGLCTNAFTHDIVIAKGNERVAQFTDNKYRSVVRIPTFDSARGFVARSFLLARPLRLIRTVAKIRPDIVHITHFHPWVAFVFLARPFFGYRIIYGVHENPYKTKDSTNLPVAQRMERIFMKRADLVAAYSDYMRQELLVYVPKERLRLMPLGAYDYFCVHFERQEHGANNPLKLLFFGPIKEYKGVDVLVRAMAICKKNDVNATLTIAGKQSSDVHIIDAQAVAALGITWMNQYVPDEEVCRLMGDADVMVIPYKEATQTTPGALALGYGMPAIATRTGGLAEQIEDGVNGLLVAPDNAEDLARAIGTIAEKRSLLKIFSEGASKLYEEKFSWKVITRKLIDQIYLSVK